jgi:hypothetical protein
MIVCNHRSHATGTDIAHPYIAVFRSIRVIKTWITSEEQKVQLFSQTCRRMAPIHLKRLLFVEISVVDETSDLLRI